MKLLTRSLISNKKISMLPLLVATGLLSACSDNDNDDNQPEPTVTQTPMVTTTATPAPDVTAMPMAKQYSYQISVTNLTNAQPMSPVAVVLHDTGTLWSIGEPASMALENLAESGDNSGVLALDIVKASTSGAGVLMPGASEVISVSMSDMMPMKLSVATMLVNTNDAFTGINAMDVHNLAVGESISLKTRSYDAGTESNSELKATIPGPAGGGEGYNSERDDVDFVTMHAGVVSSDDGLSTSALTQAHRFDNPTLSINVTRTK